MAKGQEQATIALQVNVNRQEQAGRRLAGLKGGKGSDSAMGGFFGWGGGGGAGVYLTGRVKGREQGSPLHKSLRQDLSHMLPSNAGQRRIISRVCPIAALRQHKVAHVYDDAR